MYLNGNREVKSFHYVSGEGEKHNFSFKFTPNEVVES